MKQFDKWPFFIVNSIIAVLLLAFSSTAYAQDELIYFLEQEQNGNVYTAIVTPLESSNSAVNFYQYVLAGTSVSPQFGSRDTSEIFLYVQTGSTDVNVFLINDDNSSVPDSSGGNATFQFAGLPEGAAYALRDDILLDSYAGPLANGSGSASWDWIANSTDGLVISGMNGGFTFTITPNFGGIAAWIGRTGVGTSGDSVVIEELCRRVGDSEECVSISLTDPLTLKARGDTDNDGIVDELDNCPEIENAGQADADADDVGDVCDNCPVNANNNQADTDSDERGDACDNCPNDSNANQDDADGDEVGDVCDNCAVDSNPNQEDPDNDGRGSACDNCPDTPNADQADEDNDGIGDVCEGDADSDGVIDDEDNCPHDIQCRSSRYRFRRIRKCL